MSVLRFDPASSDWVIFAPSRSLRPQHVAKEAPQPPLPVPAARCPFCPGNEALTPPEIYALREGDHWQVRVIPNKFPALRIEESPIRQGSQFYSMGGCGAHEVIVESPEHATTLAQQPCTQIATLLKTAHARHVDLMRDKRFQTVIVFKNHGPEAGTSLPHPHWQVIATPVVPRNLRLKHAVAMEYFDRTGACLYCVMRDDELQAGTRIVAENEEFVALFPYASHLPFETWILPRRHCASFEGVQPQQFAPLANLLKNVLLKLYVALDDPAFNLTIDTVPRGDEGKEYFLWHIRILPRLTTPAGFELGSGMSINTVLPEDAANFLREVAVAATNGG